jgi:geranylgeranyl diphosphate synthase, type II
MAFVLPEYLAAQQGRVEALLSARYARLKASVPARLHESMAYSLLAGGKRLRPVLCLAFADAVAQQSGGGGIAAEDAACAVEFVHTYSLVHDDLPSMDNDDLRRGRPTNHRVFGEAMAILAGDALLTDAFALLSGGPEVEAAMRAGLVRELAVGAGSAGMVGGQVYDIAEDRPADLDYLLRLHRGKTGALIKASCRMGVIAARGRQAALHAAETYGEAVGLAFQIADDVLDVTATAEALGKPAGADAAAGRHTFPAVVGLDEARRMALAQVGRAVDAIASLEPVPGPLAALARYSVERRE